MDELEERLKAIKLYCLRRRDELQAGGAGPSSRHEFVCQIPEDDWKLMHEVGERPYNPKRPFAQFQYMYGARVILGPYLYYFSEAPSMLDNPGWTSPDVERMLAAVEAGKPDLFPVLADTLEEAGCADVDLLLGLRSDADWLYVERPRRVGPWLRRIAAGLVTPRQAMEARDGLRDYAEKLKYGRERETADDEEREYYESHNDYQTLSWVMEVFADYVHDKSEWGFSYVTPDAASEFAEAAWRHHQVLTGVEPQVEEWWDGQKGPAVPFRCSC